MTRVTAAAALGLFVCNAWAVNWQELTANDGVTRYVDVDSIRRQQDNLRAWILVDFQKPRRLGDPPFREYRSSRVLWAFNCKDRTSAIGQTMLYAGARGEGMVISSTTDDALSFEAVAPDTLGEQALNLICDQSSENNRNNSAAGKK